MMPLSLIKNSKKLFIPEPGLKIKYTKVLWKKTMAYKKQTNFCVSLGRKYMKSYLKKLMQKGLTANKSFWKFMKPFLTNKCFAGNSDITLIHRQKNISDEKQMIKLFNSYYINIVEKNRGTKPKTFGTNLRNTSVHSVRNIVNSYKNHRIIIKTISN